MTLSDFFNKLAYKWDKLTKHNKAKLKKIIKLMELKEGQIVMDVGCGTGIMIPALKEALGKKGVIYAVDISEKMLKKAKARHKGRNVYFVNSDIYDLPFTPGGFDVVLCYSSFPHFKDKAKVLKVFAKNLKSKGQLVIAHSDSKEKINRIHKHGGDVIKEDLIPSKNKMKEILGAAGLKIKEFIDDDKMYMIKAVKS